MCSPFIYSKSDIDKAVEKELGKQTEAYTKEVTRFTTEIEELKESEKARVETYVKSCAEWQETINTLRAKLAEAEKDTARLVKAAELLSRMAVRWPR